MFNKKFFFILFLSFLVVSFSSCTPFFSESFNVRQNIAVEADNFSVCRRVTVYNARTDTLIFTVEGFLSISNNSHDELVITCKVSDADYRQHYVFLTEYSLYVVEDLSGSDVSPFHYTYYWHGDFLPEFNKDPNYDFER